MMRLKQFPDQGEFCRIAEKSNVVPVCLEILADTETPVSLMKKIYNKKDPAFLFESMEGGERWGRYSFLGASARSHIRVFSDCVEISDHNSLDPNTSNQSDSNPKNSKRISHNNKPLDVLREYMGQYRPAVIAGLPRFWGGMVGYITYEMVSFFEKIPNNLPPEKPLAHFIIPDELLIFDNIFNTLFLVAITFPEDSSDAPACYKRAEDRLHLMLQKINKPLPESEKLSIDVDLKLTPDLDEEGFRKNVAKIKQYIKDGDIIQAVISQPFTCDVPPDLLELYRAQRYINPSPYLFFLNLNGTALVGSSPETMVRLENRIATIRPIAGTRHRGKTEQEDRALADELLKDEKERAEHLMLVDLGRNDLGRVAETGTVQVTDLMVVERYSHVMHLVSNINSDLREDCDAWDLLAASFPTGTLSGAPKVRAMEIIADLEKRPRGPYGGAVGYVSFDGNLDMAITIRTACAEDGKLTVQAGAGIVADSDPERERQETVNKAMALQKALELLNIFLKEE